MNISFQKWHGCKNNFIVIFSSVNQTYLVPSLQRQAKNLCTKDGSSIGADGILVLEYPESSDFIFTPKQVVIINSDGSLAKNCGNGLRCAALACYKRALDANQDVHIPDSFELTVENQNFFCRFVESSPNKLPYVSIAMGKPELDSMNSWHGEAEEALQSFLKETKEAPQIEELHTCTLSNEHIVLFVDKLNQKFLESFGSFLQTGHSWDGINLHLAQSIAKKDIPKSLPSSFMTKESMAYEVLHWERGCGLTAACGSGASSVGASLFSDGFLSANDSVVVKMPGGPVYIKQRDTSSPIEMIGPASFVFSGSFEL